MLRKYIFLFLVLILFIISGCKTSSNAAYKNGTYYAISSKDDKGAFAEVSIIVKDDKVMDCIFITRQKDGSVKDANYGKINGEISNRDFYDKAQLAVRAMDSYAKQFIEKQNLNEIDIVSGATIAYEQFIEAAKEALKQAK
jgi:major membrane immunogen (membrane-anchored lipoprotein)